jgi:hypothetical protein
MPFAALRGSHKKKKNALEVMLIVAMQGASAEDETP